MRSHLAACRKSAYERPKKRLTKLRPYEKPPRGKRQHIRHGSRQTCPTGRSPGKKLSVFATTAGSDATDLSGPREDCRGHQTAQARTVFLEDSSNGHRRRGAQCRARQRPSSAATPPGMKPSALAHASMPRNRPLLTAAAILSGAVTTARNDAWCVVFGMPEEAIKRGTVDRC